VIRSSLALWVNTQHPHNLFFFVAAIAPGVDSDSGEFASFAPPFEGEGRDAQKIGDLANSKKIG